MTEEEKGYLAGIIDGEGTITLTKDGEFRYPAVSVSSTTLEIMTYLKEHFGGVVTKKRERDPRYKLAYCWKIERRKAIELLSEIVDDLLEPRRKARAKLIIADYIRLTPRNGRYSEAARKAKHDFEEKFFSLN